MTYTVTLSTYLIAQVVMLTAQRERERERDSHIIVNLFGCISCHAKALKEREREREREREKERERRVLSSYI